jgi:predicted metal-dependent enzyme (double-stranded beta helix superfamily)
MGGGIGQWLLYRTDDSSLSLFSLVVPPGSETPIHDHLAWGLVGLYRGTQDEEIYTQRGEALELVEQRSLEPGDFYVLIPPRDDIHRVRTTSAETSVSIHLLTNDTAASGGMRGSRRPVRQGRFVPGTSTWLATTDHWVSWLMGLLGLAVRRLVGSTK